MNKPNIILIVLDTVRSDILAESIDNGNMPYLASLAKDFNTFNNCIAPSSWTVPSHVSLFTGLYPSEHNVHEDKDNKQSVILMNKIMDYEGNTLPESLKELGYSNYGFVANPNLMPGSGFERGFEYLYFSDMFLEINDVTETFKKNIKKKYPNTYKDIINLANNFSYRELSAFAKTPSNAIKIPYLIRNYRKYQNNMKVAGYPELKGGKNIVNVIESSFMKEPLFMFVNFMEAHDPYIVGNGELFSGEANKMLRYLSGDSNISNNQISHYRHLYQNEMNILDKYLERIINFLIKNNSYNNSVIVITADHGQNFGEEHYYGHGVLLSDSLVRVPLLIKFPGQKIFGKFDGYQSLVNVYQFLLNSGKGVIDPAYLTTDYVFAESFGIQDDYKEIFRGNDGIIKRLSEFDRRKLALYKDGHKFLFNVNDTSVIPEGNVKQPEEIYNIILEFLGTKYKIMEHMI